MHAAIGSVSITSFTTFFGDPVGIASANFGLVSSISNIITKKKTKSNEKKKEKETIKFFSSKNWVK